MIWLFNTLIPGVGHAKILRCTRCSQGVYTVNKEATLIACLVAAPRWWGTESSLLIGRKTWNYHLIKTREVERRNCQKANFGMRKEKKMLSKAKCHKPVSLPSLVNRPSPVSRFKKKKILGKYHSSCSVENGFLLSLNVSLNNNAPNIYVMVKATWFSWQDMALLFLISSLTHLHKQNNSLYYCYIEIQSQTLTFPMSSMNQQRSSWRSLFLSHWWNSWLVSLQKFPEYSMSCDFSGGQDEIDKAEKLKLFLLEVN